LSSILSTTWAAFRSVDKENVAVFVETHGQRAA